MAQDQALLGTEFSIAQPEKAAGQRQSTECSLKKHVHKYKAAQGSRSKLNKTQPHKACKAYIGGEVHLLRCSCTSSGRCSREADLADINSISMEAPESLYTAVTQKNVQVAVFLTCLIWFHSSRMDFDEDFWFF